MANLIVLTFQDTEQAGQAFEALKKAQSGGYLKIDDAVVIVKQQSGDVEAKNQLDSGIKGSVITGSVLGILLSGVFFPLAGLAIGAVGGALIGKNLGRAVDQKFVKDVTETLKPGSSALFVMGSSDDPVVVISALRSFQGSVYHATLPTDVLEEMRKALKNRE